MTAEQKKVIDPVALRSKEITAWLCGPHNYAAGVALYRRYGVNLRLKRQFELDDTAVIREILVDELRKLAGLSDVELHALPRLAAAPASAAATANPGPTPQPRNTEAQETVRKMMRFREQYPFLDSPDCPDVLKILVADMFTAYGNYKAAHARLQALGDADAATAAADCETVVNEYLKNREIRDELEYYRENGTILGKAARLREAAAAEDLSNISDVDLIGQLRSAGVQESKAKKAVEEARSKGLSNDKAEAALEKWGNRKKTLKAELDRRKKK